MNRLAHYSLQSIVLLSLSASLFASTSANQQPADPAAGEKREPPLEFTLQLDGNDPVPVLAEQPVKLSVGGREVIAKVSVKPERLFAVGGLSFRYPSSHAFEYDDSTPGIEIWTLDGNSNVITVHRMADDGDPEEFLEATATELAGAFDKANVQQNPTELSLGGKKHRGVRMVVKVIGFTLHYHLVAFKSPQGVFILILQDTPQDDGSTSAETQLVMALLDRTFQLK